MLLEFKVQVEQAVFKVLLGYKVQQALKVHKDIKVFKVLDFSLV